MEEAAGLQRLVDEFKMTHEQAAMRSALAQRHDQPAALLKLARPVQEMLMEGALEMGHARALLALDARGRSKPHARRGEAPVGARDRGAGAEPAARPGGATSQED